MINADFGFNNLNILPFAQSSQNLSYLKSAFPVENLPSEFWGKHNVIFAIPFRSVYKELHADRETGC